MVSQSILRPCRRPTRTRGDGRSATARPCRLQKPGRGSLCTRHVTCDEWLGPGVTTVPVTGAARQMRGNWARRAWRVAGGVAAVGNCQEATWRPNRRRRRQIARARAGRAGAGVS